MTDNNIAFDWFRFAMMDLASAKHLCTMLPKPLEIICYLSQQSAEKLLKGFLTLNEVEFPRTHDLRLLCKMCEEINSDFDKVKEVCHILNPFCSQPRYPNEIEIFEKDAENALENMHEMTVFFIEQGIELKVPTEDENKTEQ